MNRHERRKTAKVGEIRLIRKDQIAPGGVCIWEGCDARFDGDMPPGWEWMILYNDPKPSIVDWTRDDWYRRPYHDSQLCPIHAKQLHECFKGFDQLNTTKGNA
jgi:hypothetical protein